MGFGADLKLFAEKVELRQRDVFLGAVLEVHDSIVHGSAITGSPGQPVDTGNLRASWQFSFPEQWVGEISTNVEYAPAIEEGISGDGPMTLRSEVGGFHSVAATRSNWDRIVEDIVRRVAGG